MNSLSREMPIDPVHAALLIIDVQNYRVRPAASPTEYYRCSLQHMVLPNIERVQSAWRSAGIEVVSSVIETMTQGGRGRSLDYKIAGTDVPRASSDAKCSRTSLRLTTR